MSQQVVKRGIYLGSQVATRVLSALLGVYAARVLGPKQLGLWAMFQIVYLYTGQAHLGTVNAMLREVPVARAHNDEDRARELVESTWGFVYISATLTALSVGAAVYCLFRGSEEPLWVLTVACTALVFVQLQSVFFNFYCFAYSALTRLAAATIMQQITTTACCILLLRQHGVAGYLASMAIGFTVMWVATLFGPLPRLRPRWSLLDWRSLISIGLPMLPGALMLYLGTSLDRLFVASRLGVTALGLFTVGAFLFQFGGALWDVAISTIYARLASLYARSNDPEQLGRLVAYVLPGAMWLSSTVQGVLVILTPAIVAAILPRYTSCITIAQILVVAINLFGVGQLFTSTLTVIGRERLSVVVRLAGLGLRAVALICALQLSCSLVGLAFGIVAGQLAYAVLAVITFRRIAGFRIRAVVDSLASWAVASSGAVVCALVAKTGDQSLVFAGAFVYAVAAIAISLAAERAHGSISRFWSFARA